MNVYTAVRFFGEPVQAWVESKGYNNTAEFVQLVHNWNQACDERGMPADERVEHMFNIYSFLTDGLILMSSHPFQLNAIFAGADTNISGDIT